MEKSTKTKNRKITVKTAHDVTEELVEGKKKD